MADFFPTFVLIALVAVVAQAQIPPTQHTVDPELRQVVEEFVKAVDSGDIGAVRAAYSSEFLNVRVADDGGFVRLSSAQILGMLKAPEVGKGPSVQSIPTKETTIQHAEVIGDMGFVLMIRVKNLGNGWEPMFYSLLWQKRAGKWELLREFVHQRSSPKHQ
jgi:ketosteroid isomerase-like protein